MQRSIRAQTEILVAEALQGFKARHWWDGDRNTDKNNRTHVERMLREVIANCDQFTHGIESVQRMLARLSVVGEEDEIVVGLSVGYKKPGRGKILWADIPGCHDPVEASRLAKARESVQALLREGYNEYGISPMINRQPKSADMEMKTASEAPPKF